METKEENVAMTWGPFLENSYCWSGRRIRSNDVTMSPLVQPGIHKLQTVVFISDLWEMCM